MRRIKSRSAVVLALPVAAALAVGGIAYASHISNTSTLPTWNVTPSALPGNGTGGNPPFQAVQLDLQTHTIYAHPGDKPQGGFPKTITLLFDDDVKINLAGIPSCTANFAPPNQADHATIAQAWERCGPGADTPPEVNAYLSPATAVSGTASTAPPANFGACALVFKRGSSPDRLLLYMRFFVQVNSVPNCSSPATNTAGNGNATLVGTLSSAGVADFGRKLTVTGIDALNFPLDDFKAKLKRASVFSARCKDTNKLLNLRGTFAYTGTGQATDTVNKTKTCT